MANGVKDIDRGYRKFLEQITKLGKKPYTKIGVLASPVNQADSPDSPSLVTIASANEFGAKGAGRNNSVDIPERSYIRSTMDERRRRFFNKAFNLQGDIFLGKVTVSRALGTMGLLIKNNIVQKITNLRTPPNKPSTISKKGSSNPLIDEGRLRGSIDYEVIGRGA